MSVFALLAACTAHIGPGIAADAPAEGRGALHVLPAKPSYFAAPDGEPVVLIGDYTWGTFADRDYDFRAMFDNLQRHHLNFARVWVWWGLEQFTDDIGRRNWIPYQRTGWGIANDGRPKYDLTRPDSAFFARLREVCDAANERGVYVQLTLFDAWMLKHSRLWRLHAFCRDNNVNGVDGDPAGTGKGTDGERGFCSMGNPKAMEYQKAFVRQVVEAVNSCGNVLFEIANENYYNPDWERTLCEYIHEIEKGLPKQHLAMPLDLPNHDYGGIKTYDLARLHRALLKARSVRQPLIWDTDGIGNPEDAAVRKAAWTAFVSGGHVDYLDDSLQPGVEFHGSPQGEARATLRQQLGHLAQLTRRVRFWEMGPADERVREGRAYVLASGTELVAYLPEGGEATLDLRGLGQAPVQATWLDPRTGNEEAATVAPEESCVVTAPGPEDWALVVVRRNSRTE